MIDGVVLERSQVGRNGFIIKIVHVPVVCRHERVGARCSCCGSKIRLERDF